MQEARTDREQAALKMILGALELSLCFINEADMQFRSYGRYPVSYSLLPAPLVLTPRRLTNDGPLVRSD